MERRADYYADAVRQMHQRCTEVQLRGLSATVLQQYLQVLEHYFTTFVECHELSLREAPPDHGQHGQAASFIEVELMRIELRERINAQIERVAAEMAGVATPPAAALERLNFNAAELGQFSGCAKDWSDFRSRYVRLVHTDDGIDAITKFRYLIDALSGRAAIVAGQWEASEERYVCAWNLLCEFYDDAGMQIQTYMDELLQHVRITEPSALRIHRLREHLEFIVGEMDALQLPMEAWATVIMYGARRALNDDVDARYAARNRVQSVSTLIQYLCDLEQELHIQEARGALPRRSDSVRDVSVSRAPETDAGDSSIRASQGKSAMRGMGARPRSVRVALPEGCARGVSNRPAVPIVEHPRRKNVRAEGGNQPPSMTSVASDNPVASIGRPNQSSVATAARIATGERIVSSEELQRAINVVYGVEEPPGASAPTSNATGKVQPHTVDELRKMRCPCCRRYHPLYKCFKFLAMPVDERDQRVSAWKLCRNCLHEGHATGRCYMASCRNCPPASRHNSVLCRSSPASAQRSRHLSPAANDRLTSYVNEARENPFRRRNEEGEAVSKISPRLKASVRENSSSASAAGRPAPQLRERSEQSQAVEAMRMEASPESKQEGGLSVPPLPTSEEWLDAVENLSRQNVDMSDEASEPMAIDPLSTAVDMPLGQHESSMSAPRVESSDTSAQCNAAAMTVQCDHPETVAAVAGITTHAAESILVEASGPFESDSITLEEEDELLSETDRDVLILHDHIRSEEGHVTRIGEAPLDRQDVFMSPMIVDNEPPVRLLADSASDQECYIKLASPGLNVEAREEDDAPKALSKSE